VQIYEKIFHHENTKVGRHENLLGFLRAFVMDLSGVPDKRDSRFVPTGLSAVVDFS